MRLLSLLCLAAEAERLRWRQVRRGYVIQASMGVAAGMFGLMLVLMLHLAGFLALAERQGQEIAALMLAGVDLLLMLLLLLLASRPRHGKVAVAAEQLRNDALREVGETATGLTMIVPLLRNAGARKGLVGAAMAAAAVGLLTRR